MKTKTLYICEVCHTDYADKKEAERCEANHKKKLQIVSQRFLPYSQDRRGFPTTIEVKDETGKTVTYKR